MHLSWRRLEAAQLSGVTVAVGVLLIQLIVSLVFGATAGALAASGAVCVSYVDVPLPPQRVWGRMLPAVLLCVLVTLLTGMANGFFWPMVIVVALTTFCSQMCMAWGLRAGPLAVTGMLALVFAMGAEEQMPDLAPGVHAWWVLAGALGLAGWARLTAQLMRRRYRDLAVAAALRAGVRRLRSRADRIAGHVAGEHARIRASIADDVELSESLQAARDQVFVARRSSVALRQIDILLRLIELRDLLLASRLDIELLGTDAAGQAWRHAIAEALNALAMELEQLAASIAERAPLPRADAAEWRVRLAAAIAMVPAPEDDARHHLASALVTRVGHMFDEVDGMIRVQAGDAPMMAPDWPADELQPFLSPEGFPLDALKAQLNLGSTTMRHALRSTLAMLTAFVIGHWLPWGGHPQWLLLTVAVVLRGNLEQTLARRNDRVIGTLIGCLLVMGLAHLRLPREAQLMPFLFIMAAGTAHAYVNKRYLVAATAATIMALSQALMLAPDAPPPIIERLADTVAGALLAWAFCFVLPAWERRGLARMASQLRSVMAAHSANVLRWAPTPEQQTAARLTRQQLYSVLGGLAAAGQRTRVEPEAVRLPDAEIEALLSHAYRYAALLSNIQQMLARRREKLDAGQAQAALGPALKACVQSLKAEGPLPEVAIDEPPDPDAGLWPEHLGQEDLTPWLLRRLRLMRREARLLQGAAAIVAKKD
ncbi:FUSC family protein [Burkholderiaceae bacterium UC74_6]